MSSHFPGSRPSVYIAVAAEDKCLDNKCSLPGSFFLAFIAEQTTYGMKYPFSQFGSAVPVVSLPKILPTPSGGNGEMLERKPWGCM